MHFMLGLTNTTHVKHNLIMYFKIIIININIIISIMNEFQRNANCLPEKTAGSPSR